jgi:hypothetical protein
MKNIGVERISIKFKALRLPYRKTRTWSRWAGSTGRMGAQRSLTTSKSNSGDRYDSGGECFGTRGRSWQRGFRQKTNFRCPPNPRSSTGHNSC